MTITQTLTEHLSRISDAAIRRCNRYIVFEKRIPMDALYLRKKIQLILLLLLFLAFGAALVFVPDLYPALTESRPIRILACLLAATLFSSLLFLFLDLSYLSKQKHSFYPMNALMKRAGAYPKGGLKTLTSLFEKYKNRPLPEDAAALLFSLSPFLPSLVHGKADPDNRTNKHHVPATKNSTNIQGRTEILLRRQFGVFLKLALPEGALLGQNEDGQWICMLEHEKEGDRAGYLIRIREMVHAYNEMHSNELSADERKFLQTPGEQIIRFCVVFIRQSDVRSPNISAFLNTAKEKLKEEEQHSLKVQGP